MYVIDQMADSRISKVWFCSTANSLPNGTLVGWKDSP